jgi:hypothetical protein
MSAALSHRMERPAAIVRFAHLAIGNAGANSGHFPDDTT